MVNITKETIIGTVGGLVLGGVMAAIPYQISMNKKDNAREAFEERAKEIVNDLVKEKNEVEREKEAFQKNYEASQKELENTQKRNRILTYDLKGINHALDSINGQYMLLEAQLEGKELLLKDAQTREDSLIDIVINDLKKELTNKEDSLKMYKLEINNLGEMLTEKTDKLNATQQRLHQYGIRRWFVNEERFNQEALEQMPRSLYETRDERRENRKLYRQLNK
jgi:chromosome segregation ATPase